MLSNHILSQLQQQRLPNPDFEFDADMGGVLNKGYGQLPISVRSTTKTIKDFEGILRTCKVAELACEGYRRVENKLSYTENFNNAVWLKNFGGTGSLPTVTSNFALAPDGTMTATRIILNKGAGTTGGDYSQITQTVNSIGTRSIWLKTNDNSTKQVSFRGNSVVIITVTNLWKRFSIYEAANGGLISVSLQGVFGTSDAADLLAWHPQMENTTGQANTAPSEYVSRNVLAYPYHGYGVDGVRYFKYTNGNTVSGNVVTEAQGTLIPKSTRKGFTSEPQKTNLVLYSEDFSNAYWIAQAMVVAADNIAAPSGELTADRITADTTGTSKITSDNITITESTIYTCSMYVKKGNSDWLLFALASGANNVIVWVNLGTGTLGTSSVAGTATKYGQSISDAGNGWYRISITASFTTTPANIVFYNATGDGLSIRANNAITYIWGAQFEQNKNPSSYIPTTSATVTRNADLISYPATYTNISSFIGTVLIEFTPSTASIEVGVLWFVQKDANNFLTLFFFGNTIIARKYLSGILYQVTLPFSSLAGTRYKAAMSWEPGGIILALDGVLSTINTNNKSLASIGTVQYIGQDSTGASQPLSAIKNIKVFRTALTTRQLKELTL